MRSSCDVKTCLFRRLVVANARNSQLLLCFASRFDKKSIVFISHINFATLHEPSTRSAKSPPFPEPRWSARFQSKFKKYTVYAGVLSAQARDAVAARALLAVLQIDGASDRAGEGLGGAIKCPRAIVRLTVPEKNAILLQNNSIPILRVRLH